MGCSSAARGVVSGAWPDVVYHVRMVFALTLAAIVNVAIVMHLQGRFVVGPCKTEGEREYVRLLIWCTNPIWLCVLGALGHIRPHFTTTLVAGHCTFTCIAFAFGAFAFCNDPMWTLILVWTASYFLGAGLVAESLYETDWRVFFRRVCVGWSKLLLVECSDHAASMDCCICWGTLERAAMLNDCGHVLCVDCCAHGLALCPKCRAPVTGFRRVFL